MHIPAQNATFKLDFSGVAGFFGGDEAISAMATVHIYKHRKLLGWYNSPGSFAVGKRYGRLANSTFWNGIFPGVPVDPTALSEFEGSAGPEFKSMTSGTLINNTGQTGYLFMKECRLAKPEVVVRGRTTSEVSVTIAQLNKAPEKVTHPDILLKPNAPLLASIPILTSLAACALCGVYGDWYCFFMILLGVVTNGLACYVIGSGTLTFTHPIPAPGSPMGDGILKDDTEMVILIGEEGAVNSVTRGKFSLKFKGEPEYRNIGLCSLLLNIQLLVQLLLLPQGKLFGQLMFVSTLAVSWGYNSYLSSDDKERIQRHILVGLLRNPILRRFKFGCRTAMAVFVLLHLRSRDPELVLDYLLPNDTKTWKTWKKAVLGKVKNEEPLEFNLSDYLDVDEKELLEELFGDANTAYIGYQDSYGSAPTSSGVSPVYLGSITMC